MNEQQVKAAIQVFIFCVSLSVTITLLGKTGEIVAQAVDVFTGGYSVESRTEFYQRAMSGDKDARDVYCQRWGTNFQHCVDGFEVNATATAQAR